VEDPSEFHSVQLLGYSGTVTATTAFSTMILKMTSGAFTQYLMPPGVQYQWVSEDLYVKTGTGNPPPPVEG
jgi:hypothetical protein